MQRHAACTYGIVYTAPARLPHNSAYYANPDFGNVADTVSLCCRFVYYARVLLRCCGLDRGDVNTLGFSILLNGVEVEALLCVPVFV